MSSHEVEKLKELTNTLPPFPNTKTEHFIWNEYQVEKGTCFAWYVFERPEVGIHRWFNSRGTIQRHHHKETEIIIVYEGELKLIFETPDNKNEEHLLTPGDFIIIQPNAIHQGIFLDDTQYVTITIPKSKDYPHGSHT